MRGSDVNIYYEEAGSGTPVVLIHGWPVSHEMWEYQLNVLPDAGLRCIAYDRRGFGKSDKPGNGYDYDSLAGDLHALIEGLGLQNVVLVGFSMAGGEAVRYCSKYGCNRLSKVVLVSAVTPYMLKTGDNPEGTPQEMFDEFYQMLSDDRPGFLANFGKGFYGVTLLSQPVSQGILDWQQHLALHGSSRATLQCLRSFSQTDFRPDMAAVTVPTLIIHGDADKTVPIKSSGDKSAQMIPGAVYKVYEGEPHGLFVTAKDRLNNDLIEFIAS